MELAVGDSVGMEVTFSTKYYTIPVIQLPSIQTNTADSIHRVEITALVVPASVVTTPLTISGWPVVLTGLSDSVSTEYSVEITNTSANSVDLTIIDYAAAYFDVDMPFHIEPGQTATCGISVFQSVLSEKFKKSVTIEVSDSAHTRFTIPVRRILPLAQ
jgi:hypothetical protein